MAWLEWVIIFGVPTAITSIFSGLLTWKIQRTLNRQEERRAKLEKEHEKEALAREKHREKLILMQLQSTEAAIALSKATAKAVQRIPDAKCNGDMSRALEYARKIQGDQKQFLFEVGIQSLCECDDEAH